MASTIPRDALVIAPHSTEAEECVLGSCLIDPEAFPLVAPSLWASDFFHDAHRKIADAMVRVASRGMPTEFVLVCDELKEMGVLEAIGGEARIARLLTAVPTAAHVEHYAWIVRRDACRRALMSAAADVMKYAHEHMDDDPARNVDWAIERMERVKQQFENRGPSRDPEAPIWQRYAH